MSPSFSAAQESFIPIKDYRKRWNAVLIRAGINKAGGTRDEYYHYHDLFSYFAELIAELRIRSIVQSLFAHQLDLGASLTFAPRLRWT